jgi:N-acetyl-alpha-D-muramate 1-phosphate uridylyltransferase
MATRSEVTLQTALVLAAGRGERMRPLTDHTPKPLLAAGGRRLIEWQLDALGRAGICRIVINTAHFPSQFEDALGDGTRWGVQIRYSRESESADGALETLGGVVNALPLLGTAPFLVVSGDIVTDFDYSRLEEPAHALADGAADAYLVLVDNPPFHPQGDMGLVGDRIEPAATPRYTYANIGVFAPRLFAGVAAKRAKLFPWLYGAANGRLRGEVHHGRWHNVGNPAELADLDRQLRAGISR